MRSRRNRGFSSSRLAYGVWKGRACDAGDPIHLVDEGSSLFAEYPAGALDSEGLISRIRNPDTNYPAA